MRELLAAQSQEERDHKSRAIEQKLLEHPSFKNAGTVCFYVGMPTEVNTRPMIERALLSGKKVLVPLVDLENKELKLKEIRDTRTDLAPGTMGILEPLKDRTRDAEVGEVQCCLVPALAFNTAGYRLGHGGGFYDRFLSKLSRETRTIGLAFSFQVLPELPLKDHDLAVDIVLTEK